MSNFSDRLKELLKTKYLSQKKFAELTDLGQGLISLYVSDTVTPTITAIEKIGKAMNVNLNWLILGEGEMFRTKEENLLTIPPEDLPKEQIKEWLDDYWSHANADERAWLKIEIKKKLPEFAAWLELKYK